MKTAICPCRICHNAAAPASSAADLPSYIECCQKWHQGITQGTHASSAELLMRARYSAYALATTNNPQGQLMLQYLHATWHVSSAPGDLELSPTQWQSLDVLHAEQTDAAGVVEFVARYKVSGKAHVMHETSRFVATLEAGGPRWWYIDGQVSED
jgi:SEC-C motif domain protein